MLLSRPWRVTGRPFIDRARAVSRPHNGWQAEPTVFPACASPVIYLVASWGISAREPAVSHPIRGSHPRTFVNVGKLGCLRLRWLAQMGHCRCHQVLSIEFSCFWSNSSNFFFYSFAFVLGTSAILELRQTSSPKT